MRVVGTTTHTPADEAHVTRLLNGLLCAHDVSLHFFTDMDTLAAEAVDSLVAVFPLLEADPEATFALLRLLIQLSSDEGNREVMVCGGAVTLCAAVLQSSFSDTHEHARAIVCNLYALHLSLHAEQLYCTRELTAEQDLILQILVGHLHEAEIGSRAALLAVLEHLARDDMPTRRRLTNDHLSLLLQAIECGSQEEQIAAASVIVTLIDTETYRTIIAKKCGVVDLFVQMFVAIDRSAQAEQLVDRLVQKSLSINSGSELIAYLYSQLITLAESGRHPRSQLVLKMIQGWTVGSASLLHLLVHANVVHLCCTILTRGVDASESIATDHTVSVHLALQILQTISVSRYSDELLVDGILDAVIAVLSKTARESRGLAVEVLHEIAWRHPSARSRVGRSSCLDMLVAMLRDGNRLEKIQAAGALSAVCQDCKETVERLPCDELIELCAAILANEATQAAPSPNAALRLVTSLASQACISDAMAKRTEITKYVLYILEYGWPSNQTEASQAVLALMVHPVCRQHLVDGGAEQLLEQLTGEEEELPAGQALRTWRLYLYAAPNRKTRAEDDDENSDEDGFVVVEEDDCDADEIENRTKQRLLQNLMQRLVSTAPAQDVNAVLAVFTDIGHFQLSSDELVRAGLVESIAMLLDNAFNATSNSKASTIYRFEATVSDQKFTHGLVEVVRGLMNDATAKHFEPRVAATKVLTAFAESPHLCELLGHAGCVDMCVDVLVQGMSNPDRIPVTVLELLALLASSSKSSQLLENGTAEHLWDLLHVATSTPLEAAALTTLRRLAGRHRAVQALLFASDAYPSTQVEVLVDRLQRDAVILGDDWDPTRLETLVHDGESFCDLTNLRAVVPLLSDRVQRAKLVDTGVEAKLVEATQSDDRHVRLWARAGLYWLRATTKRSVEFAVGMFFTRDGDNKVHAALNQLVGLELPPHDNVVATNVFAVCVASLLASSGWWNHLAVEVLVRLQQTRSLRPLIASLRPAARNQLATDLLDLLESTDDYDDAQVNASLLLGAVMEANEAIDASVLTVAP